MKHGWGSLALNAEGFNVTAVETRARDKLCMMTSQYVDLSSSTLLPIPHVEHGHDEQPHHHYEHH